jgi:hypothetical protein
MAERREAPKTRTIITPELAARVLRKFLRGGTHGVSIDPCIGISSMQGYVRSQIELD